MFDLTVNLAHLELVLEFGDGVLPAKLELLLKCDFRIPKHDFDCA